MADLRGVRVAGVWHDEAPPFDADEWAWVHPQFWRVLEREGHDVIEAPGKPGTTPSGTAYAPGVARRPQPRRMVRRWLAELLRHRHPKPPQVYASARWYKRTLRHSAALEAAWRVAGLEALLAAHDELVGHGGHPKLV